MIHVTECHRDPHLFIMVSGLIHQSPNGDFLDVVSIFGKRLKFVVTCCLSSSLLWLDLSEEAFGTTHPPTQGSRPACPRKVSVPPGHGPLLILGSHNLFFCGEEVPKRRDGSLHHSVACGILLLCDIDFLLVLSHTSI